MKNVYDRSTNHDHEQKDRTRSRDKTKKMLVVKTITSILVFSSTIRAMKIKMPLTRQVYLRRLKRLKPQYTLGQKVNAKIKGKWYSATVVNFEDALDHNKIMLNERGIMVKCGNEPAFYSYNRPEDVRPGPHPEVYEKYLQDLGLGYEVNIPVQAMKARRPKPGHRRKWHAATIKPIEDYWNEGGNDIVTKGSIFVQYDSSPDIIPSRVPESFVRPYYKRLLATRHCKIGDRVEVQSEEHGKWDEGVVTAREAHENAGGELTNYANDVFVKFDDNSEVESVGAQCVRNPLAETRLYENLVRKYGYEPGEKVKVYLHSDHDPVYRYQTALGSIADTGDFDQWRKDTFKITFFDKDRLLVTLDTLPGHFVRKNPEDVMRDPEQELEKVRGRTPDIVFHRKGCQFNGDVPDCPVIHEE